MNLNRKEVLALGLAALPKIDLPIVHGRNGEELATDEAAVWKRVINYRVSQHLQPNIILETHKGPGISTSLYRHACPNTLLVDHYVPPNQLHHVELIDIDPFGQPWDTIAKYQHLLATCQALFVSNGEAYLVVRNLRKAQRYPTNNFGRRMPKWILEEYLPQLEKVLGVPCQFFYAFPTTVRSIHSKYELPSELFTGCPRWMWWLPKYVSIGG